MVKERSHILRDGDHIYFMAKNKGTKLSRLSESSLSNTGLPNVAKQNAQEIKKSNELLNLEKRRVELRKIIQIYYKSTL